MNHSAHGTTGRRTEEQKLVPEGIAFVDGMIPNSLHDNLMKQIDDLKDGTDADYHPHSNNIVRDLVHPALYSYIKGVSPTVELPLILPAKFAQGGSHDRDENDSIASTRTKTDYWGRKYEESNINGSPPTSLLDSTVLAPLMIISTIWFRGLNTRRCAVPWLTYSHMPCR